ncbi:tRNA pseudouridine(55) synthase TruB [Mycoplasmopsis lipofaciens]|uniref:tRNA pseudouridine(55) synthase TruB n=1 Tax=Mycoplasmopsis lipofaciens TaxID=114884 RepID=UPI0004821A72|nr:tRNA pseudouridine(55) synthase TruB [Mycoplasmopsis lipofaciens]
MFYLINKEKNISSFKAIKTFAKKLKINKVGHTGTLDPMATGLLLVATDDDTKLISYIENKIKAYVATIRFQYATDTFDAEGNITYTSNNLIQKDFIPKILDWLLIQNFQIPPIYSAKKINGIKSYELARKNKDVILTKQKIKVFDAKILDFNFEKQILKIYLKVSEGTYIRSLANDLAIQFNTYGHLIALDRVEIGSLNKNDIKNNNFSKIDITPLLKHELFFANKKQIKSLKNGFEIDAKNYQEDVYFLVDKEDVNKTILGIVESNKQKIKVKKLFGNRLKEY